MNAERHEMHASASLLMPKDFAKSGYLKILMDWERTDPGNTKGLQAVNVQVQVQRKRETCILLCQPACKTLTQQLTGREVRKQICSAALPKLGVPIRN